MTDGRLEEALRHLQPPRGVRPWHGGATVQGALRGVRAELAAWKPAPDRHGIWDLTLHIAYWKYTVWRRLAGAPRGGFERSPSNWPSPPAEPSDQAWAEDRKLLARYHDLLVEALREFDPARLDEAADDARPTTHADLITGILLHDTYHVGQIQLLKRLARSQGLG